MKTELYRQIQNVIPALHGWCDVPKAVTMANLVLASGAKAIVEIGTWGGRSALPMALACKANGAGVVSCIDPWSRDASVIGQTTDEDRKWWESIDHEMVYQHFLGAATNLGVSKYINIIRKKSSEVVPPATIDLLHCDGNHGQETYDDTVRFGANVVPGGFCVLDDLNWVGGHVLRSAEWLKANGFIELHPLGSGALYLKMG